MFQNLELEERVDQKLRDWNCHVISYQFSFKIQKQLERIALYHFNRYESH
jgi:hypothetical protein